MDAKEEEEELKRIDYLDVIGIQPLPLRNFGKERGLNPIPNEAQQKEISKLALKLSFKGLDSTKEDDLDEVFDILSRPRVILYEGKVTKKSKSIT